jgi:cytochrome c oxidase assembly protein subunit 15
LVSQCEVLRMQSRTMKRNKVIERWLVVVSLVIVTMVGVGGATRLTHSGLSMVEWKPIQGILPPLNEQEWQAEFSRYQQFPEYQILNKGMSLEAFKRIFYWEYGHRVLGRVIGLLFFIPLVFFWVTKQIPPGYKSRFLIALGLGGCQGLMGWYMVKSGLIDVPRVSHFRLAAHLSLALAILGYLYWLLLDLRRVRRVEISDAMRAAARGLLALLTLQIVYGAFTAGMRAGLGFNTYPKMGEVWLAEAATTLLPFWHNLIENGAMIQFIHRWLAIAVVLYAVAMLVAAIRSRAERRWRRALGWVVILILIQVVLGIATLLNYVPISLALVHQVMACFVLLGVLYLNRLARR